MFGSFATASRRTPHYHSPGVATVASHATCASMSTTTTMTTTTTTTRDRPLWPHGMGPKNISIMDLNTQHTHTHTHTHDILR